MKIEKKADLYFQDPSINSDKVYHVTLETVDSGTCIGYVVNFAYGRRGSTLNTGTKTNQIVGYAKAEAIFDKLVDSKLAKGYKYMAKSGAKTVQSKPPVISVEIPEAPEESPIGTVVNAKVKSGLLPSLLTEIGEKEATPYFSNNLYCGQEKFNGKRIEVIKVGKTVIASNKKGFIVGIPKIVEKALKAVPFDFTVDGELVGETYWIFDARCIRGDNVSKRTYDYRYNLLKINEKYFAGLKIVPTAWTTWEKEALCKNLKSQHKEGMVFKLCMAPHTVGLSQAALKFKFWHSASCIVLAHNDGVHSIQVGLYEKFKAHIYNPIRNMGSVTVGQKTELPDVNSIVEVKYLYVKGLNGKFYQPSLQPDDNGNFIRDDVDHSECTVSKQKLYYAEAPEVDSDKEDELYGAEVEVAVAEEIPIVKVEVPDAPALDSNKVKAFIQKGQVEIDEILS